MINIFYFMQKLQNAPISILENKICTLTTDKETKDSILFKSIVKDLLFEFGFNFKEWNIIQFINMQDENEKQNYLRTVILICFILNDKQLTQLNISYKKILDLILNKIVPITKVINAKDFVYDIERREELIRLICFTLELEILNEKNIQSLDRLKSLDSIERIRIIEESKKSRERARQLKEAMELREAEEAASKYNRE